MANPEHIKILQKGVEAWNKWREENTNITPDLSEAYLPGINLSGAKLDETNLMKAELSGANLSQAKLSKVNLNKANLHRADFTYSNLSEANLEAAYLVRATLIGVNLQNSNLSKANLHGASLSEGVNLSNAVLDQANFKNADLRGAYLQKVDITGANLWGTARFGWQIEEIKCDYIYFDRDKKNRIPKDRNFKPGEFERLYRFVPTVEVIFERGMDMFDPALLAYIAEESKETKPELKLELRTIELKGFYPSAVFEIADEGLKGEAEKIVKDRHQEIRNNPDLMDTFIHAFKEIAEASNKLAQTNQKLIEMIPNNRNIHTGGGNYYEGSTHTESFRGSKTIAQNIERVNYNDRLSISEQEFDELKDALVQLHQDQLAEIEKIYTQSKDKEDAANNIKSILINQGINIANGISASALFETIKLMIIG